MNKKSGAQIFKTLVEPAIVGFVEDDKARAKALQLKTKLPPEQQTQLDAIMTSDDQSYPPGVVVQAAYALSGYDDLTTRHPGGRSMTGKVGRLLAAHHIPGVKDAYQNIGKNNTELVRGNFKAWDDFLEWGRDYDGDDRRKLLEAVFKYACAHLADQARPIKPLPEIDRAKLTFARTLSVFRSLLEGGSEGAHEQFTVAALLHALVAQYGVSGQRVDTKSLNASDKSSRTAGDVQVLTANRVIEALEVTANDWETKTSGAEETIRSHDLTRLQIVANVEDYDQAIAELKRFAVDLSVIHIESFVAIVTAVLTKQFRAVALERLYELLDRNQPVVQRVNDYVDVLTDQGLTVLS